MDVTALNTGERIAGAAGGLLVLAMLIFKWFGLTFEAGAGFEAQAVSTNAWGSFAVNDLILFLAGLVAIGLAVTSATQRSTGLPIALSAFVTALGILATALVVIRLLSPPDLGADQAAFDQGLEHDRKFGAYLGLILSAGIAVGGWLAMRAEGTGRS